MSNKNKLNAFEEVQKANELLKAHAVKEGFSFDVSHLSPEKRFEFVLRILADYVTSQYEHYLDIVPSEFSELRDNRRELGDVVCHRIFLENTVKFLYEFLNQFIKPKEIKK